MSERDSPSIVGHENLRVLIVEDDRDFAISISDVLKSRNYEVEVAHSAHECLEKIGNFDAQVALLDIRLKTESGVRLIADLQKQLPGILCVMMTAYASIENTIEALQEGAYDYLRKPMEMRDLFATLDRCFEKLRLEKEKATAEAALREQNQRLADLNARLRRLVESTKRLQTCPNLDESSKLLLEECAQTMGAEGGSLYMLEHDKLILIHSLDPGHSPATISMPPKRGSILDRAMREEQPVLVADINVDGDLPDSGWAGYTNGSLLVLPLMDTQRKVMGFINLHNKDCPPFTEQDREIGTVLSSYSYEVLRATQAKEKLRESERRYRSIFENIQDIYFEALLDGTIIEISPSVEINSRYRREDLIGKSLNGVYAHNEQRDEFLKAIEEHGVVNDHEILLMDKDGTHMPCSITAKIQYNDSNNLWKMCGTIRNISIRKQAEDRIKDSLKEKEVLLKEIHHRVKNNMQIISSMLRLQSVHIHDERDIELIRDSINRVRSMALVHEKLYRSHDLAKINFLEYLKSLTKELFKTYEANQEKIRLILDSRAIHLGIDKAIPCALIINEIISNALKYAFPDNRRGEIQIEFGRNERNFRLVMSDNGVGIPEDLDFRNTKSMGLQLVNLLTEQLNGEIELDRNNGTKFTITF
jgi:PAS domain S-box-containing protein